MTKKKKKPKVLKITLSGPTGVGKTTIAQFLAKLAVEANHTVTMRHMFHKPKQELIPLTQEDVAQFHHFGFNHLHPCSIEIVDERANDYNDYND